MIKRKVISILVIFQIVLLINAIVAQPYLIHQAEKSGVDISIINNKKDNPIKKVIILLSGILSIKQIGTISAWSLTNQTNYSAPTFTVTNASSGTIVLGCCKETREGAVCENLLKDESSKCKTSLLPTECSQVNECKLGCCIDNIGGICNSNAPKGKCEATGGTWSSEKNCNTQVCQKGCCILGGSTQFVTEKNCEMLGKQSGLSPEFKDLNTEIECLALSASQETGACVSLGGGCSFKTEKECMQNLGTFHKNYLCSNPSLETTCTKQASVGCIDGRDEIYWFDSCGNRENIYNSNRDISWNGGKVLTKSQSCNPSSNNINSTTCGNCNRAFSSVCSTSSDKKIVDGEFVCKSLQCKDSEGKTRQNGESWCVYDSFIGDGKDTVGSEHWRAFCNKGTVEVDRCGDYRGRICVQSVMNSGTKNFSVAACATNTGFECTMYNGEDKTEMKEKCEKNENCVMKNLNIDSSFSFDFCVAKYPKGFNPDSLETNKKICSTADIKCSVQYSKGFFSGWSCDTNCQCEKKVFSDKMNDFCISLGDCGTYVNYKGNGTNNTRISGAPANNWKEYINYSKPLIGQYAKSQNINTSLYLLLGSLPQNVDDQTLLGKVAEMVSTVSGGIGLVAMGLQSTGIWTTTAIYSAQYGLVSTASAGTSSALVGASAATGGTGTIIVSAQSLGVMAAGAAIGAMVGSYIASSQGITGTPAAIITIASAVVGAIAMYAYVYGLAAIYPVGTIIAIVMIVIIALISWMGWGKTSIRTVSFQCLPWEAPLGGDDCSKCNDNPLMPCTEYRCESLGQACVLLNPESELTKCESVPKEAIAPTISPGNTTTGYKFDNITQNGVKIVGKDKECIPEFTPVSFILKTDENAQCIYSSALPSSKQFEDMGEFNYPKEGNAFTINHTFGIFMPSLSSLSVYDVNGTIKEKFGKVNMYLRCRDYWGNYNLDEYVVNFCINSGPDLSPVNHAYTIAKPQTKTSLPYGAMSTNVSLFLNEPAECKYSNSSGKSFDEMEYFMSCDTDVLKPTNYGWGCNTTLNDLKKENKFYLKCKDQPWFAGTINETNRNINQEDYEYELYVSESPLNITKTSPEGIISRGIEPTSIDLEVQTSGGSENGLAYCYWGENTDIMFMESYSTAHKQTLSTVISGTYSIPIKCEDSAHNIARTEINFSMELDTTPPMVVRTYKSNAELVVLTDEKASCYYDFQSCNFDLTNATSMTTALSTTHSAPWEQGKTYYIKCKDIWDNTNPWCAIRIQPN